VADLGRIMVLGWQIGQIRRAVTMNGLRYHFRLTWIALAAIVGILSVVGDASASAASAAARNVASSCCVKRVCTGCCCSPESGSTAPLATERSVAVRPSEGGLSTPSRPCECRSSEPGSPASRDESRFSEDRADQASGESVSLNGHVPAAVTFTRHNLPTASPPKSPLYLRTARLLI
jgi:hypothetical protein